MKQVTYSVLSAILSVYQTVKRMSVSVHFNGHYPDASGLAVTITSPFWILLELRMPEVVVTTGAIRHAEFQMVTTNK